MKMRDNYVDNYQDKQYERIISYTGKAKQVAKKLANQFELF